MEAIYNTIGTGYNSTRQADPYITDRLLHFLQSGPDKHYLDIGCGTGNYTIALANRGLNFTGVEPSEKMLDEARNRNHSINWLAASAEKIPADNQTFDGVLATLTIHHWTDRYQAFKEIHRVTKNDGKLVVFTATPEQMEEYWLNYYFPQMMRSSIIQMPSFAVIEDAMTTAGFKITVTENYFIQPDLQDHFLYAGKHRPEIYLDEDIRKGISSFAALANVQEVKTGLQSLQTDVESGKFAAIKERYNNDLGDYLFIAAEKI